jgi:hypothetical protein
MPHVASTGTYLPCWENSQHRVAGDDVAEVHDCFTGVELIGYEDLGFAPCVDFFDAVTILEGPVAHGR